MGNVPGSEGGYESKSYSTGTPTPADPNNEDRSKYRSFPGSAILEKTFCGSIDTTDPEEYLNQSLASRLIHKADVMCISSPNDGSDGEIWDDEDDDDDSYEEGDTEDDVQSEVRFGQKPYSAASALLARALVNEVTDNPQTMKPEDMAAREKQLLRAQQAAKNPQKRNKPIGAAGAGVGPPQVLSSVAMALTGDEHNLCVTNSHTVDDLGVSRALHDALVESGAQSAAVTATDTAGQDTTCVELEEILHQRNPFAVTIALCLSRRYEHGHPESVTRQTAFDFNELQDRDYQYVSSTDPMGWRAGGGESGEQYNKKPHPDQLHLPIIHLDCGSQEAVDKVIHALASGDIFIPHMNVLPDSLAVHGSPLPDLMLRWQCERNDDLPADEWPNWCLEFIHNQIYEYFQRSSVRPVWMPRPFSVTLAKSVRWRTVKHMNKYFSGTERVLEQWRERGPQYLDPQHSYTDGGASREEVARPHGIYIWRTVNGELQPTNYFGPNFDPPYTTKMTRSLLSTVLAKSWDSQRREWASQSLPVILSPSSLLQAACGCTDAGGFVAKEVTASAATPRIEQGFNAEREPQQGQSPEKQAAVIPEEKKTDDKQRQFSPPVERSLSANVRPQPARRSTSNVNSETGAPSVATTVMHSNYRFGTHGGVEKRLYSDEDWAGNTGDPPGERVMPSDGFADFDRFNQGDGSDQRRRAHQDGTSPRHGKHAGGPNQSRKLDTSDSGSSLAYSVGTGFTGYQSGYTSNIGQIYADGASTIGKRVSSSTTKSSSLEDFDDSLSFQDSTSTMSVVPTDEELYAIGWAKALDPESGNFYYFTLDRKKIMWDNPLPKVAVKNR